jgi:hypothetical protein
MVEGNKLLKRLRQAKGRIQLLRITTGVGLAIFVSLLAASQAHAFTFNITRFNVKSYGATGNGTTDDTIAITNAIAAANKSPGSTVFFPTGRYLFTQTLRPKSVVMLGENQQSQLICAGNSAFILLLPGDSADLPTRVDQLMFVGATLNASIVGTGTNWAVSNCQFSHVSVAVQASAANSQVSGGMRIHDNSISDPLTHAFQFDQCSGITVEKNAINSTQQGAAQVAMLMTNCRNLTLNSNTVAAPFAISASNCTGLHINSNTLSQFTTAYQGQQNNTVTLSSNTFTGGGPNVPISEQSSTNVVIKGNTINNVGDAIQLVSDQNVEVIGNTINTATFAVFAQDGSKLEVSGNNIRSCVAQGIYALTVGGTVTLSGNVLENCGLFPIPNGQPKAVIAASCPAASKIAIDNNTYTGNTTNLQYFIYSGSFATATGNRTNTTLPNFIYTGIIII